MFDLNALESPKGRVELIETIGKGNFGYVYRGRIVHTSQLAAVKVVLLKEDELREILLEVEILRDCKHANVVQFIGNYIRNDDLWICMEYCGGGAVDSLYKNLPRQLAEEDVAFLILETFKGLAYLHQQHIIHRDIKSGNLLITDDGNIKLADFGVSALTTAGTGYKAHTFIGTPYWMAPEVIMSENTPSHMYDSKADIWSTGIMAVEIADKSPPLSDIHPMRAIYLIPTADSSTFMLRNPGKWTKLFVAFLQACLVKDPRRRPSAADMLAHPWLLKADSPAQLDKSRRSIKAAVEEAREEKLRRSTNPRNVKAARQAAVIPPTVADPESSDDEDDGDIEVIGEEAQPAKKTAGAVANPVPNDSAPATPTTSGGTDPSATTSTSAMSDAQRTVGTGTQSTVSASLLNTLQQAHGSKSPQKSPTSSTSPFRTSFINVFRRSPSNSDIQCRTDPDADLLAVEMLNLSTADSEPASTPKQPYDVVPLDMHFNTEIHAIEYIALAQRTNEPAHHFILVGTEKGLYAVDTTKHSESTAAKGTDYLYPNGGARCRALIAGTRFKQLAVVEEYGVLVALCGKYSHIRSYSLNSLKKLIAHTFGIDTSTMVQSPDHDVHADDDDDDMLLMPFHLTEQIQSPEFWANDYIKAVDTRESQSFVLTRTAETCYLGVMFARGIVIFEWAKLPYLRFMKVKQFWLPEKPKFFSIMHDGETIVDLMVVYEGEANRIEFESSKVIEIRVLPEVKDAQPKECARDKEQFRWLSWIQLPAASSTATTTDSGQSPPAAPPVSWYNTMKQMKPQAFRKPVPPRQFLGTFGACTQMVNENGELCQRDGEKCAKRFEWSRGSTAGGGKKSQDLFQQASPSRILVVPKQYVVGVHKSYIEVANYADGSLLQTMYGKAQIKAITPPSGVDVLERRRGRIYFAAVNKKSKTTSLYWLRETISTADLVGAERAQSQLDKLQKASKVLGTGTFSAKKKNLT